MSFGMEACTPKCTKSGHKRLPESTGWSDQVSCPGLNSAGDVPVPFALPDQKELYSQTPGDLTSTIPAAQGFFAPDYSQPAPMA